MPDVSPTETQTPPADPRAENGGAAAGAGDDPLAHLHKMSTTAGLGTTEYVAINGPAVFALIFGLASALAIVDNILLIVPVAAVVCAGLALWQIAHSNGTQTGRGLAIIGLLLALAFGGYVVANQLTEASRTRADREAIAKVVDEFGADVIAGRYKEAYARFAPRFQSRVSPEIFERVMAPRREFAVYGKLESIKTASLFHFQTDPTTGARVGASKVNFKYANIDQPAQEDALFRKMEGQWRIEDLPTLFPSQQQQR